MILHWHNPTNGRRYQAVVGTDLLGDSYLWRGWSGADGRRGGERQDVFTWESDCLSALHRVIRRRRARGYVLLDGRREPTAVDSPLGRPGEPGKPGDGRAARVKCSAAGRRDHAQQLLLPSHQTPERSHDSR